MIKFSPIFPGGAPGAALLLMRIATAAMLLLAAFHWLIPDDWRAFAAVVLAVVLLVGLFTRPVAILSGLMAGVLSARTGGAAGAFLALHCIHALALALLGAGAYSIDARLFGRRVIRLDDRSDRSAPGDPFG